MTEERPLFQHPPWMVGIMLILGALSLLVGLTVDPFWLVIGSPAILTLVVYIGVRVVLSMRLRRQRSDAGRGAGGLSGERDGDEDPEWGSQNEPGPLGPDSTDDPHA